MSAGGRALTIGFLAALAPVAAFAEDPAQAGAGVGEACMVTRVYDVDPAHGFFSDGDEPATAAAQALAALAARHRLAGSLVASCTVQGAPAAGTEGLLAEG